MRFLLSSSSLLGALLMLPAGATLAQDPYPASRTVAYYSAEELDNLVAPVALYPDALLAQILVASTFPDQIEIAARHVRERGTRDIDRQGWDLSVKAVAYYPPILNMLANQDDWAIALGQAYAGQSGDVMDSVQRLREMARAQGNLVSTPEHAVSYDRDRIIIVPANPQVIYVPTYDPAIVYLRPVFGLRAHGGYFSFGIGFPIGSWLVYDVDWWGRRVYYDGWYGGGWRQHARRYIHVTPVYVHPRHRIINLNINIFSRRVNYVNLDRRYRNVRQSVRFDRPGRDRYVDRGDRRGNDSRYDGRDRRRDGDGRGPIDVMRDRYDPDGNGRIDGDRRGARPADRGDRDGGNDRIGNRVAGFDDFRPDRGGNDADARDREPVVTRGGFGTIEKSRGNQQPTRGRNEANSGGNGRTQPGEVRGSRPDVPVFRSQPRAEAKASGNGRAPAVETRSTRASQPTFQSQPRAAERKSSGGQVSMPAAPAKATNSAPSVRATGSGGAGKVKPSGGGTASKGGGGKGRKQ
jgi:hypothetical protein